MASPALPRALAGPLQQVAPAGFSFEAEDTTLVVRQQGGLAPWLLDLAELQGPFAVEWVLDAIQDEFSETTTDPWPGKRGVHPMPFSFVQEGAVRWGYGDPESPVLEFPPLSLAELIE